MKRTKKNNKIRVYGPCGSGKSFLSKNISRIMGIQHFETDNMIWNREENIKYNRDGRNDNLKKILNMDSWLIEGAQYKWSFESFVEADLIIFLDPNPIKLISRIIYRFIKMQIKPSHYNYKQSFQELIEMLNQSLDYYRTTKHDFLKRIEGLSTHMIKLKDSKIENQTLQEVLK